jgi:ubiquinone biosynthesis protein
MSALRHRLRRERIDPQSIRDWLSKRGPIYVKLGQFLALRPDLIPQDYCDVLLALVDRGPARQWNEIEPLLFKALGAPPDKLFRHVAHYPVAVGSLAQVHVAIDNDGRRLAVKCLDPAAPAAVDRALNGLRRLLPLFRLADQRSPVAINELLDELRRWLALELDLRNEAANLDLLCEDFGDDRRVVIPRPIEKWSSELVLVSDFIDGVPFSELIRLAQMDENAIARRGFDADLLAERFLKVTLEQIFDHGRFRADNHPGNLIAAPGNRIGYVDAGLMERLSPDLRTHQLRWFETVFAGDTDRLYRALLDLVQIPPAVDTEALKSDLRGMTRLHRERHQDDGPGEAAPSSPVAGYMIDLMRLIRRHGLRAPPASLGLYRTLLTAESVVVRLSPNVRLATVGAEKLRELRAQRAAELFEPDRLSAAIADLGEFAASAPQRAEQLLDDLTAERFVMHVRTSDSSDERAVANDRTKLLALAALSVAAAVLTAAAPDQGGVLTPRTVGLSIVGLIVLAMAHFWRRLRR